MVRKYKGTANLKCQNTAETIARTSFSTRNVRLWRWSRSDLALSAAGSQQGVLMKRTTGYAFWFLVKTWLLLGLYLGRTPRIPEATQLTPPPTICHVNFQTLGICSQEYDWIAGGCWLFSNPWRSRFGSDQRQGLYMPWHSAPGLHHLILDPLTVSQEQSQELPRGKGSVPWDLYGISLFAFTHKPGLYPLSGQLHTKLWDSVSQCSATLNYEPPNTSLYISLSRTGYTDSCR